MKKLLIVNALIWAAVILITAYLFKDSEEYGVLFGVLIVASTLTNGLIHQEGKKRGQSDC